MIIEDCVCSLEGSHAKKHQHGDVTGDDDDPTMYSSRRPSKRLLAAMEQMEVRLYISGMKEPNATVVVNNQLQCVFNLQCLCCFADWI